MEIYINGSRLPVYDWSATFGYMLACWEYRFATLANAKNNRIVYKIFKSISHNQFIIPKYARFPAWSIDWNNVSRISYGISRACGENSNPIKAVLVCDLFCSLESSRWIGAARSFLDQFSSEGGNRGISLSTENKHNGFALRQSNICRSRLCDLKHTQKITRLINIAPIRYDYWPAATGSTWMAAVEQKKTNEIAQRHCCCVDSMCTAHSRRTRSLPKCICKYKLLVSLSAYKHCP